MRTKTPRKIKVLQFTCMAAVRFFERCAACPRFKDDCRDLKLGKKILRGQKRLSYGVEPAKGTIHVNAFNCLAPLHYIDLSRIACPHHGRCRGEGLLLALLDGKAVLDYSRREIIELPSRIGPGEASKKAA
jgi:hypothetical protein